MTSGNAFRDGAHASVPATNSPTNGDTRHASKRRKVSPPPQANIFTKTGDATLALEVDHMILDFLSYEATNAVLKARRSRCLQSPSLQHKLAMVDAFHKMFEAKHPDFRPDKELRFRLLLLELATLFCHRLARSFIVPTKHALHELRDTNTSRAKEWIHDAERIPSSKHKVSGFEFGLGQVSAAPEMYNSRTSADIQTYVDRGNQNRQIQLAHRRASTLELLGMPAEDEAYEDSFYGTAACLALMDILSLFMSVIAARNELNNSNLSTGLMELMAEFMLQACLEQYLVCGASGCDAIDEAFAWGHGPSHVTNRQATSSSADLQSDESVRINDEMNLMFSNEDDPLQEIADWNTIKSVILDQLACDEALSVRGHLEELAYKYPIDTFEEKILQLLSGLAASLPTPVLAQLEDSRLDGMTSQETEQFLRDCGLNRHWPVVAT